MRGVRAALLALEGVVVGLAVPAAVTISDVSPAVAIPIGAGVGLACLFTAGILRRPYGERIGSALQVVVLLTGLLTAAMFFLGAIFAILWFVSLVLSRKIAAQAAAYEASRSPSTYNP